ncbi:hypothetical protein [Microbispora sp. ATCC PTA-5024]|uniref:hypothetical protein n=1 Tax=Microbispora sp. ATCC PTA-5024 TaxID=316330 RepID=UPI0003DC6BEF|nr:hypothetical protein [Microbispora sp. ATCC PTA-5024]ETK33131.1 hypothetical protein MPTA5024_26385 [Microbispora sp. ATCC PTA-5024]
MGVLVDYFAADEKSVRRPEMAHGPAGAGLPYVDCKGWLDGLDGLAAELTSGDPGEFGAEETVAGPGDDDWLIIRVSPDVVAALAAVGDERLDGYADDELLDEFERKRLFELRDLTCEAVRSGMDVYCWMSL